MIRLSELLTVRGFMPDAKHVKLVRHKDSRIDLEALRAAGWLDTYQKYQSNVVAWLRPGVSLGQANAEIKTLSADLTSDPTDLLKARLTRPGDREWRSSVAQTMIIFRGASAFVLAIVSTNLANLMLVRNLTGQREIAIRDNYRTLGVSDFLYAQLIEHARAVGSAFVSVGPSPTRGYFRFKQNWRGVPLGAKRSKHRTWLLRALGRD